MDVIGWNRLAAAMITDLGQVPASHRNCVRKSAAGVVPAFAYSVLVDWMGCGSPGGTDPSEEPRTADDAWRVQQRSAGDFRTADAVVAGSGR